MYDEYVQIRSFFWSVFSRIQSKKGEIWTRKKHLIWTLFTQFIFLIEKLCFVCKMFTFFISNLSISLKIRDIVMNVAIYVDLRFSSYLFNTRA